MHVFLLRVPHAIDNMNYADILSCQRIKKVSRLKSSKIKCVSIFSELMVKYLVKKEFNINYNKIEFGCNEYGKPYVKNLDNFHYNVSHSGDYIICAVNKDPIGIDIELARNINMNIAERFFCQYERNYINQKENDKLNAFFDIWTLKESIIKADGKGMNMSLNSFSVIDHNYNVKKIYKDENHEYFLKQYNNVLNGYKIALCSTDNDFEENITNLNYPDLL